MQNESKRFCRETCRGIICSHFLVHEASYECFFSVRRHIFDRNDQEWLLRNLADPLCGMLRVGVLFSFLQYL